MAHVPASSESVPLGLRPDWLFELVAAWQLAIALDRHARRADVIGALRALVALPDVTGRSMLEGNLARGYRLELARGLRAAKSVSSDSAAALLDALCGWLELPTGRTDAMIDRARDALGILAQGDREHGDLAVRVRALIDQPGGQRLTASLLARMLGTNTRRVERAFRTRYGESVASYRRKRQAKAALDGVVMGLPLKSAIDVAGCSESTLRRRVVAATGRTPRTLHGRSPVAPTRHTNPD
jgi:AraC-like DNA-binding protein